LNVESGKCSNILASRLKVENVQAFLHQGWKLNLKMFRHSRIKRKRGMCGGGT